MYTLYGNGVNDDTDAIQELLDSGKAVIELPVPENCYCISRTLRIHSGQTLMLGDTAVIRLLPRSDCLMLTNAEEDAHDIVIRGGIWDFNNLSQSPNPYKHWENFVSHRDANPDTVVTYTEQYTGVVMRFFRVTRLTIRDLTVKDPVLYCIQLGYVHYFTVENIRFDQNFGNPTAENMDGIHVDGGCRFGLIRNVQGTCYDDVVALNADDMCDGPIEDIEVDGVFGRDSLRGVRLLSIKSLVARISISNIFGTFYQNCIGLTYFYPRSGVRGRMEHISIRNIYGANAPRRPEYQKFGPYGFSFLWIDGDLDIDSVTVDNLFRREELGVVETVKVCKNCKLGTLSLSNAVFENHTGAPIPMICNEGEIGKLYLYNVDPGTDTLLQNEGHIGKIVEN